MLYGCQFGADVFTSAASNCEGHTILGEIGAVYAAQPASPATVPLYRCNTGKDHFESLDSGCEGVQGAVREATLGYTVAYGQLSRHNSPVGWDHLASIHGTPPGYQREGSLGVTSLTAVPGGTQLFSCKAGIDMFLSADLACEGRGTALATVGWVWAAPPDGLPSASLYRCLNGQETFESLSGTCEGRTVDRQLGYVLTAVPGLPPTQQAAAVAAEQEVSQVAGTRPPFPIVVGWIF
jgi:hypothetical protein